MAVSLALAACGRDSGAGGGDAGRDVPPLDDAPATGTLEIWAQGGEADALPQFAEMFMAENPDLKITVTPLPWDAAHNKYQTSIASGSTPDLAQMGTTWMADFSDAFTRVPEGIDTSVFFEGSLNTNRVGEDLLGVPWYVDTRVIYFRKDLAEQIGYPEGAETWDEFKEMAKAMQEEAGAEFGINFPSSGTDSFQSVLFLPWSNGASLVNEDQTEWTLDSPEFVESLEYYKSFFDEGISDPNPETGAGAGESAFVNGTVPMVTGGPSWIGSLSDAGGGPEYKDQIGVMRVPASTSSTSFTGGSNFVVFKQGKNPVAAWKFARFMSQPEIQIEFQKVVGDLPAVMSAWDDPSLSGDPLLSVFGAQLEDTNSPPAVLTWTEVSSHADKTLERIARGGADPAEALKTLQSTAAAIGTGS